MNPAFFLALTSLMPCQQPPSRDGDCSVAFEKPVVCAGEADGFVAIVNAPLVGKKGVYALSHGPKVIVQHGATADSGFIGTDREAVKKPVRIWAAIMEDAAADAAGNKISALLTAREGPLTTRHRALRKRIHQLEGEIDAARRRFAQRFFQRIETADKIIAGAEARGGEDLIVGTREATRAITEVQLRMLEREIAVQLLLIGVLEGRDDDVVVEIKAVDVQVDAVISAGTPNDTDHFDVVEVESVHFKTVDANPNVRGGFRVFPDPQTPNDGEHRDVEVAAQLRPKIGGVGVWFKTVDVDDPFSDRAVLDPTGPAGDDNTVYGDDGPRQGIFVESGDPMVKRPTDGSGRAVATLRVNRQPGNNFQVVACCDLAHLAPYTGTTVSWNRSPHRLTSEMLTVWRRLHVEADSMAAITGAPGGNKVEGKITAIHEKDRFARKPALRIVTDVLLADSDHRFQKGRIVVGTNVFDVFGNTGEGGFMSVWLPRGSVGLQVEDKFKLYDDDFDGTVDRGVLPQAPFTHLMPKAYADAYLGVFVDGGGDSSRNGNNVPPVPNVDETNFNGARDGSVNNPGIQSHADRNRLFWILYIQSAFQGPKGLDNDPNSEKKEVKGLTLHATSDNPVGASLIFRETIRDELDESRWGGFDVVVAEGKIVVHETGHQFDLPEHSGGYMSGLTLRQRTGFRDAHLWLIRTRARSPGVP